MISIKDVDVVGIKEFISKKGDKMKILYWMCDDDPKVQGVTCGQIFVSADTDIDLKKKIKIAFTGKGWEYVK